MNPYVIAVSSVCSIGTFVAAMKAIPQAREVLFRRGIFGIDLLKTSPELRAKLGEMKRNGSLYGDGGKEFVKHTVPESIGIVVGGIYFCTVIVALLALGFPMVDVNAVLTSIAFMLLLGFVDDVLDVKWRYKIVLSLFGTMPLMMSYAGSTGVVVPTPLRGLVGTSFVDLGFLYVVYLGLFCVFCTNGINIYAGINGLEVGQSIVVGVAQIIHNVVQMTSDNAEDKPSHLLSFAILCPFVAGSLAIWLWNKYPSRVFVGDSYCYFAGMTLAVAGIEGHYTKTMMLFFLPQLINFALSLPQLFGIVPCPRHRVPTWNPKTNKLVNSRNYTLINAALWVFGDMHEARLTTLLLVFQALCCALAFVVRYYVAGFFFEVVK